ARARGRVRGCILRSEVTVYKWVRTAPPDTPSAPTIPDRAPSPGVVRSGRRHQAFQPFNQKWTGLQLQPVGNERLQLIFNTGRKSGRRGHDPLGHVLVATEYAKKCPDIIGGNFVARTIRLNL